MHNSTPAHDVLKETFGYQSFRGTQQAIIERTLAGKHSLVLMPTGGGKSLCYQVPALVQDGLTVVLSPLIALMKDQVDALNARGIDATFINSSLTKEARIARYRAIENGSYRLLYVTPERFQKSEFRRVLEGRKVPVLAVDEAHCVSQWGHDFRPDYTRVGEIRQFLGNPTTLALTATATHDVQQDIVHQLGLQENDVQVFHEGIERPNLALLVEEVWGEDDKLQHLLHILKKFQAGDGGHIVYFTLIKTLERFSHLLEEEGISHGCYHGNLRPVDRKRMQERFLSGKEPIVLATNAFGMGIDKANIRTVTHAEVPGSLESYYQEIGRAGRDGLPSQCTLLYDQNDLPMLMEFIRWANPDADFYRQIHYVLEHDLEKVNAFGIEWLNEKILGRQARHDRRLESALLILERFGSIEFAKQIAGTEKQISYYGSLPESLTNETSLAEKLRRDQQKLLAMVEYARCETDRREFLKNYFLGTPSAE